MILEDLQGRMCAEALKKWKADPETRDLYGQDIAAYVNETLDQILREIWQRDASMRDEFFDFEGFRAFAFAEQEGKAQTPNGKESILI